MDLKIASAADICYVFIVIFFFISDEKTYFYGCIFVDILLWRRSCWHFHRNRQNRIVCIDDQQHHNAKQEAVSNTVQLSFLGDKHLL